MREQTVCTQFITLNHSIIGWFTVVYCDYYYYTRLRLIMSVDANRSRRSLWTARTPLLITKTALELDTLGRDHD